MKSLPKNGAGNMFQGIFIKDCPGEAFLPEQAGDIRQKSNSGTEVNILGPSTSRNSPLNITTAVIKTDRNTIKQSSNSNMMLSTSIIPPLNVASATCVSASPDINVIENTMISSEDNAMLNTGPSPKESVRKPAEESPMLNALLDLEKRPVLNIPVPVPSSKIRFMKTSMPKINIRDTGVGNIAKKARGTASVQRTQKSVMPVSSFLQNPPDTTLSTNMSASSSSGITYQTFFPSTSENSSEPLQSSPFTESVSLEESSKPSTSVHSETPAFFKQSGISPWSCKFCNKYYKTRETLQKHKKLFCPNKSTCSKCGKVLGDAKELAIHQKLHIMIRIDLPEENLLACTICDKKFAARSMLRMHKKTHDIEQRSSIAEPEKQYKCPSCSRMYVKKINLDIHIRTHHSLRGINRLENNRLIFHNIEGSSFTAPVKQYKCPSCSRTYVKKYNLDVHIRTHHSFRGVNRQENSQSIFGNIEGSSITAPVKQYKCPSCSRTYVKKYNLKIHIRTHHSLQGVNRQKNSQLSFDNSEGSELPFTPEDESKPEWQKQCSCKYCGQIYEDSTVLWMHMIQQHSEEQAFRCEKCGKEFNQQQAYLSHKKTMCVKVRCRVCGKIYSSPKALREHEWSKHGIEKVSHRCRLCGQSFVTRSALLIHGRVHHIGKKGNNSSIPVSQEEIDVPEPESSETQQLPEQQQQLVQQESPNFTCRICYRKFSSSQGLERHIQMHATGKHVFYPCEICGKKFVSLEMYKTHAASHSVSQSFLCSRCNKIFFKEELFRSHSCESSSKQACLTCGSMLTEEEHVSHVCGEKDDMVHCSLCSAVFTSYKGLASHMRTHKRTSENQASDFQRTFVLLNSGFYKCNLCGKITQTQQGAAAHSRWHIGPQIVRPFKCPFCNRTYSSESGLYGHITIEHPESA
ncbi:hypothetical protein C0J52_06186 [Blattella germanica]|nr:hypothetical protein C0J52_06186 [Blattella germanica]